MTASKLAAGYLSTMAMLVAALVVAWAKQDYSWARIDLVPLSRLATDIFIGVMMALVVIGGSRWAILKTRWGRNMQSELAILLGDLSTLHVVLIALTSSLGEEALFRGALMPVIGLWPQALLFTGIHIGPDVLSKKHLSWLLFTLVMGVLLGGLAQSQGHLAGVIVAHFLINVVNLRVLVRPRQA